MQLSHRCQPGRCGSRSQCTPAAAARGQRRSGACIQPRPPGSRLSTRRHRAQLLEPVCSHAEEASEPSTSGAQARETPNTFDATRFLPQQLLPLLLPPLQVCSH